MKKQPRKPIAVNQLHTLANTFSKLQLRFLTFASFSRPDKYRSIPIDALATYPHTLQSATPDTGRTGRR